MDTMLNAARAALAAHLNTPASSDDAAAWIAARDTLRAVVLAHEDRVRRAARKPSAEARAKGKFRARTARGLRP